jgi:hypothetical protein
MNLRQDIQDVVHHQGLEDERKSEFEAPEDDRKDLEPWTTPSRCCM